MGQTRLGTRVRNGEKGVSLFAERREGIWEGEKGDRTRRTRGLVENSLFQWRSRSSATIMMIKPDSNSPPYLEQKADNGSGAPQGVEEKTRFCAMNAWLAENSLDGGEKEKEMGNGNEVVRNQAARRVFGPHLKRKSKRHREW